MMKFQCSRAKQPHYTAKFLSPRQQLRKSDEKPKITYQKDGSILNASLNHRCCTSKTPKIVRFKILLFCFYKDFSFKGDFTHFVLA